MPDQLILGLDPGAVNFGWAQVQNGTPVACGLMGNTVKDLKDPRPQLGLYLNEIQPLVKPCANVVVERYQTRSVGGGKTIMGSLPELVNIMIGGLLVHRNLTLVPAMVWKSKVKKTLDLNLLYKVCECPPHVVDAAMMAWVYSDWNDISLEKVRNFVHSLESCYTGKLRKIRDKRQRVKDFKNDFNERANTVSRSRRVRTET